MSSWDYRGPEKKDHVGIVRTPTCCPGQAQNKIGHGKEMEKIMQPAE